MVKRILGLTKDVSTQHTAVPQTDVVIGKAKSFNHLIPGLEKNAEIARTLVTQHLKEPEPQVSNVELDIAKEELVKFAGSLPKNKYSKPQVGEHTVVIKEGTHLQVTVEYVYESPDFHSKCKSVYDVKLNDEVTIKLVYIESSQNRAELERVSYQLERMVKPGLLRRTRKVLAYIEVTRLAVDAQYADYLARNANAPPPWNFYNQRKFFNASPPKVSYGCYEPSN